MVLTQNQKVRYSLIAEDNTTLLTNDYIELMLADAAAQQTSTDAVAVRWYTCYLIASSWQSLGFVTRMDGTTLVKPDPDHFLDKYNKRIKDINVAAGNNTAGMVKQSLDKRYQYDSDGVLENRVQ